MATATDHGIISIVDELRVGKFVAHHISDDLDWGQGDIRPQSSFIDQDDQRALLTAAMESIEPVTKQELAYSACTDGRMPVRLLDGEMIIPVREQMVGADIVSAFYVAETLGASFYKDPEAPVASRVKDVAMFLQANGLIPSSHISCGAATHFKMIVGNVIRFTANPAYVARLQALLPGGIYTPELHDLILKATKQRLENGAYEGLTAQTFIDAVEAWGGKHGIAELRDDNRGIHGHVEEQIIRLRIPGHGINECKLAKLTDGREVFGVNDNRIERVARLFGRGDDKDYRIAHIALEDFVDAAHGTLAKDLPTYVIEEA